MATSWRSRCWERGCPDCNRLMQMVMDVLEEMKINVDLEHVRSPARIGQYGVMGTPALVVNNMVKAVGFVPAHERIRDWVGEALNQ